MVCRDQVLFADFTKKGVNGAYTRFLNLKNIICFGVVMIEPLVAQDFSASGVSEIDDVLGNGVKEFSIPGAVALVTNGERNIYLNAFGMSDSESKKPMTSDAIFRIASMTKPITSIGVLQLLEDGKIGLDDPISEHLIDLPQFEVFDKFDFDDGSYTTRPAQNEVTIRHLLTHTSGVAYNFNSLELTRLGKSLGNPTYPLQHEPGDKWTYGASTRLLGDLIMEKTGQGLFEFFKESLLRPLDMNETFFEVPEDDSGRVVTIHQRTNKAFAEIKNPRRITAPEYGDGGLNSTASDYAKFLRMLLNNGTSDNGKLVLRPETIEMLASNHIGELRTELQPMARPTFAREFPVPESRGVDYWGLGFQIAGADSELGRSKGSLSWAGIFNTKFWVDREKNIGAILFMQYLPFEDKAHLEMLSRFEEMIYKNLKSGFGE